MITCCIFADVIIVVLHSWKSKVASALERMEKTIPWMTKEFKYRFHTIADDCNEDEGTATSLLKLPETRKVSWH